MKKRIVMFCVMLLFVLIGCGDSDVEEIDWANIRLGDVLPEPKSKSMKILTNSDENLSVLGINCHAGEHLNFLFETEPDVSNGDTVVVRVTEEPTQIFLLESWKVPCEFLEISKKAEKTEADNSNDTEGGEKEDIVSDTEPEKPKPVFYSTNDRETAKKGNTGVFSYKSKGGSYDVYN